MANFCSTCGNPLCEEAKFCVKCGSPVRDGTDEKSTFYKKIIDGGLMEAV